VAARDGVPGGHANARKYMRMGAASGTGEQAPAPRRQRARPGAKAICVAARSYRGLRRAKVDIRFTGSLPGTNYYDAGVRLAKLRWSMPVPD
jgi:hypothetical protein